MISAAFASLRPLLLDFSVEVHFSYKKHLRTACRNSHFATVDLLQLDNLPIRNSIKPYRVKVVLYH
jgi:hypothetical protein